MLIAADERRCDVRQLFNRFQFGDRHITDNRVVREHGTKKLKRHFPGDEVHIAAYLGWYGSGQ